MSAVARLTPHLPTRCPSSLALLRGWLVWRFEPGAPGAKPRKVPYYATGGRRAGEQNSPEDIARLVTFEQALRAAQGVGADGVGFAPRAEFGIVALDFDDCVVDGNLDREVAAAVGDTYAELSPSGKGVRAFYRGALGNGKPQQAAEAGWRIELFSSKGFVTFTGKALEAVEMMGFEDTVAPLNDRVRGIVQRLAPKDSTTTPSTTSSEPLGLSEAVLRQALDALPIDLDYDAWVNIGMALHHETRGEGFEVWEAWSQRSPKYGSREYNLDRWRSFGKRGGGPEITARTLVKAANERGACISLNGPASAEEFDLIAQEHDDGSEFPLVSTDGAAPAAKPARFAPTNGRQQFAKRPAPRWIVEGVLPQAELVVLFGESGSGKSFVALDIAAVIGGWRGPDAQWRGKRVRQGRTVYIAAEGAGGFAKRLKAYIQHHNVPDEPFSLDVIDAAPNFLLKEDALDLAKSIGRADVVIVDTWAQVTPGGNENSGEDMGKALAHCKGIHRVTGALVILVHHSGKDASKGARGWSGLRAAADAELEVVRLPGGGRFLHTSKQKDGDDDQQWGFSLEVVEIGRDEWGTPITSCVVVDAAMPTAQRMGRPLGVVERAVVEVVNEIAESQTAGIEVDAVIAEAASRLDPPEGGKRDTRKQQAKRALQRLCDGDDAMYFWDTSDNTLEVL